MPSGGKRHPSRVKSRPVGPGPGGEPCARATVSVRSSQRSDRLSADSAALQGQVRRAELERRALRLLTWEGWGWGGGRQGSEGAENGK